ncbi:MAG TPA: TonB-dependent receptor [Ferruginibacter sp.]|jgi:Fe(3+) dicitrate transport protein|nr:TonB-dependent receptor [Ferruginibacter sp.]
MRVSIPIAIFFTLSSLYVSAQKFSVLDSVKVKSARQSFGIIRLNDVDGAGIYAGKKSEVIVIKDITANTATNNARQIYSKIAGLNIWENDGGAGIQLSIGGRGLDPNRTSNFNTRQNGYDISADALGYPESYYTPPAEVVERIEIVRGASSLQYGTQFGGIINFRMNSGVDSEKAQVVSRLTGGSWGFANSSTSIGGTASKVNYYAFYQHKQGDGWRPNSHFNDNTAYISATLKATRKLSITAQYTFMSYLEHQPGGLPDSTFNRDPRVSTKTRNWFRVNWNLGAVLIDYAINNNLKFNSRFFGLIADRSALGVINTVIDVYPDGPRQYRTDSYMNYGNESRLIYTYNTKRNNPFVLLTGVRYYNGYTDRRIGDGNYGSGGTKADFAFNQSDKYDSLNYSRYTFPSHNTALFAENIFRVNAKLSIIPGVRYENIVTKADGFYNNVFATQTDSVLSYNLVNENRVSNRSFLIGGIGVSYTQSSATQLYANISQNYRAINFNDMSIVNSTYLVDPNLKDETGYSADMGIRGHISDILNYDVSIFTIHYNNKIGMIPSLVVADKEYVTNISQSRNIGFESFAEVDIWKLIKGSEAKMKVAVFSNLSFTDARYVHSQNSSVEGNYVESVPPVILKTGITLQKNRFTATYQYSYMAKQFGDATNATTPSDNGIYGLVPSYYVMDLTADYKLSKRFMFSGSINNLTNHMYYTRRADSYPGPGIIPADARSFYLTLQVKL